MTATALSIAVVVPAHNTIDLTLRCVAAVLSDDRELEIIVVDDGGSDQLAARLAPAFPSVRVLRNEEARGFTVAANLGLGATEADILFLLNSDTEVRPGAFKALRQAFAADSRLGIAGAQLLYPDGRAQWSAGSSPGGLWLFSVASGLGAGLHSVPGLGALRRAKPPASAITWVSGAAMAIRRSAWRAAGPFDENFRFYAQDLDLCERAGSLGWGVRLLPGLEVLHHHGATIGRAAGAVERQQPGLLWTDLLGWAIKTRSPVEARSAARALKIGARCRLAWRSIRGMFLHGERGVQWRAETAAYHQALDSLNTMSADSAK
ncbi:MAG: glycosyltransferase family 2 protein [Acidobacteriota bacterium]